MKKIQKLLVANRGEIACRVMRTCRDLGISTVAVYSDIDRDAVFAREADEAFRIGESGVATYLDQERIIRAARETGADAIHPGYGLLSENPDFAANCRDAGITFIGPPTEAMTIMGSKIAARELCERIGVPVVPGFRIDHEPFEELAAKVSRTGYPVLIKASAGGGGIGIFRVDEAPQLEAALDAARSRSLAVYGNDHLLVEKYLSSVRHVEFQVLGDLHGNVIHFFERECSVQRRHQKLVEESPSPAMTVKLRKSMGDAAVAVARAVGYSSAGTVEFALSDEGKFYFLEMNTRLQVEHPVTEAVTGYDLVALQIAVAEGEPLPVKQEDLSRNGHAIECRIYAEDPDNGFLPSAGDILLWKEAGIARTDSGVDTGSRVAIDFDPLLAKVIVHAHTRDHAIRKMRKALEDTACLGVATNIDFLSRLVMGRPYQGARIRTDFFDKPAHDLKAHRLTSQEADALMIAGIVARFDHDAEAGRDRGWQGEPPSLSSVGFILHGKARTAEYRKREADRFEIVLGKTSFEVIVAEKEQDGMALVINGHRQRFRYALEQEAVFVRSAGLGHHCLKHFSRFESMEMEHHGKGASEAPMDGRVTAVRVARGERVEKGRDLIVIESMKMENVILADREGIVKEVFVSTGDFVRMGTVLIEIETENDS